MEKNLESALDRLVIDWSKGRGRLAPVLLLIAGVLLSGIKAENAEAAGRPQAMRFKYVKAYQGFPSADSANLGFGSIKREAALIYYKNEKKQLAGALAKVLEKMHVLARKTAGFPISVHGLILLNDSSDLPKELNKGWLNVDGVACLVRVPRSTTLPFKTDLENHMFFPLMIHESVDMGIKETFFADKRPASMDWRWWLEGIADYCAYQACRKYQPGAFNFAKKGYLEKLNEVTVREMNLLDEKTWFPEGYEGPGDVNHAYGASHYIISQLVERNGSKWIGKALHQFKADLKTNPDPDFFAIVKALAGEDIGGWVRSVKVEDVKRFAESL